MTNPNGLGGSLLCPDYNMVCTSDIWCNNMYDCIDKKSTTDENTFYYISNKTKLLELDNEKLKVNDSSTFDIDSLKSDNENSTNDIERTTNDIERSTDDNERSTDDDEIQKFFDDDDSNNGFNIKYELAKLIRQFALLIINFIYLKILHYLFLLLIYHIKYHLI